MAYVSQTSDEEKNKLNTQGGTTVSTGTTTNTTPNKSGSGWVNLDKYLNANQEQTQEMYKPELEQVAKEGSDLESNLQGNYDTYISNLQSGLQKAYNTATSVQTPTSLTNTSFNTPNSSKLITGDWAKFVAAQPTSGSTMIGRQVELDNPRYKSLQNYLNQGISSVASKYNYDPSQYKTDYETYKNKYSDISAGDLNTMLQNKYGNRNVSTGVNTLNQYLTKQSGLPKQLKNISENKFNNLYNYLNTQKESDTNKIISDIQNKTGQQLAATPQKYDTYETTSAKTKVINGNTYYQNPWDNQWYRS